MTEKIGISISLDKSVLADIEFHRKFVPRSKFIENILIEFLQRGKKNE